MRDEIMREYYTNVSVKGAFLFRTDWDANKERAMAAAAALREAMPHAKVETFSRATSMRREEA